VAPLTTSPDDREKPELQFWLQFIRVRISSPSMCMRPELCRELPANASGRAPLKPLIGGFMVRALGAAELSPSASLVQESWAACLG
jgi:hypothetical protein